MQVPIKDLKLIFPKWSGHKEERSVLKNKMHRITILGLKPSPVHKTRSRQETTGILTYKGQLRNKFISHRCHWLRLSKIDREIIRIILLYKIQSAQRANEVRMKIDKSTTQVYCNKIGDCHQPPRIKMEGNSSNKIIKGVQTVGIIHSKWVASQLVQAGIQTKLIQSTVWV